MDNTKKPGRPRKTAADDIEQEMMGKTSVAAVEAQVEQVQEPVIENILPGTVKEIPVDPEYKIEVIKDYHGNVDIFYLPNKDPRYEYRFLRDDSKNLSASTGNMLLQGGGWQLCDKAHLNRIGIDDRYVSADGLHRRGDLILAFIPKHLYKEKRDHEARKSKEWTDSIDKRMAGGSNDGMGIHESMKGLQTQEQLGIK